MFCFLFRFDLFNHMLVVRTRQHTRYFVSFYISTITECTEHIHRVVGTRRRSSSRVCHAISHNLSYNRWQMAFRCHCLSFFSLTGHSALYSINASSMLYCTRSILGYQRLNTICTKTYYETCTCYDLNSLALKCCKWLVFFK